MKTGIFITARLGSTRLQRKHLLPVMDKPIITYLIKRIEFEFLKEISQNLISIVVVTGNKHDNKDLEKLCDGYDVYFGNDDNIPLRHSEAARDLNLDCIISVDGDDILCSPSAMRQVYTELASGSHYVKTEKLPLGMNVMGYSSEFLFQSVNQVELGVLDTGWGRIFDERKLITIKSEIAVEDDKLRFTLDYDEDFTFFRTIIEGFGEKIIDCSDLKIISYVNNHDLHKVNSSISVTYWNNFRNNIEKENASS